MDVVGLARILGLEATLAEQNGVIRPDRAQATGLSRNRVDDLVRRGRWVRALPAVYALPDLMGTVETPGTSFERLPPQTRIRAVWLWAGHDSVIGGDAAAWWLGLSPDPPETITVLVPPGRRLTGHPGVRVVRAAVERRDIRDHHWVRVTAPSRTCLDLARSARPDRLTDALRLRKVEQAELLRSLERGRGRRGQVRARTALREVATNPWSAGEKVAHRALIDAGVTGWVANPPIPLSIGTRYPDVAFEDIKLAVEIDGRQSHDNAEAFDKDRVRHNAFVQAGWVVLQFTPARVARDPRAFVTEVTVAVERLRRAAGTGE